MSAVAVDIDSTLYDFETPARQAFLDIAHERGDKVYFRGAYADWLQWRSPADALGEDVWMDVIQRVHSPEIILAQTPFAGSVEVLSRLADQGYELLYASNRRENSVDATDSWLRAHDYPEGTLVCTMADKMAHISECQYIIDDRPKTLVQFIHDYDWKVEHGLDQDQRKGFGLMYEYNRGLTDVPGLYLAPTWSGIGFYLERKGVLKGERHTV